MQSQIPVENDCNAFLLSRDRDFLFCIVLAHKVVYALRTVLPGFPSPVSTPGQAPSNDEVFGPENGVYDEGPAPTIFLLEN